MRANPNTIYIVALVVLSLEVQKVVIPSTRLLISVAPVNSLSLLTVDAFFDGLPEDLREDQWERIDDSLPGKSGDVGRTGDHRRFIEAVMWIGCTGAPWRSMPIRNG